MYTRGRARDHYRRKLFQIVIAVRNAYSRANARAPSPPPVSEIILRFNDPRRSNPIFVINNKRISAPAIRSPNTAADSLARSALPSSRALNYVSVIYI